VDSKLGWPPSRTPPGTCVAASPINSMWRSACAPRPVGIGRSLEDLHFGSITSKMQAMFSRWAVPRLHAAAATFPVVVVLGARQVGKTTLARAAFGTFRYFDLEDPRTAERFLQDARFELDTHADSGLVLDEAQAVPSVFSALRGAVDARRSRNGRFVVLGSAQPALMRAVSESLAGRAAVSGSSSITAAEAATGGNALPWAQVWLKGGFPDALRGDARGWWESYLRLVLERDLPQYGVRAEPLFMRRLLTMLAHQHGGLLNASALGNSLGTSHHTVLRHLDVLESIHLLRRLQPYFRNVGKRLTKAAKVYLRDSGLLHHLLNISTAEELSAHPSRGASWEGFVIEDVWRRERLVHPQSQAFFWRTAAGAEIDLLLDRGSKRIALEVKAGRGDDARAIRTLREAMPDVDAARGWIVDQAEGIERVSTRAPGLPPSSGERLDAAVGASSVRAATKARRRLRIPAAVVARVGRVLAHRPRGHGLAAFSAERSGLKAVVPTRLSAARHSSGLNRRG
jgi:uncharacterized protein